MQEFVDSLMENLSGFLPDLENSIKLGIIGGIVILLLFAISCIIASCGRITKYRKQLISSIKYFNQKETITDANVEEAYEEIKKHPEEVGKGWSTFLDQRVGYPSDYVEKAAVFSRKEFNLKSPAGSLFLGICGAIVWCVIALIGFMSDVEADTILKAITGLEFLIIPVAIYIICLLLLDIIYNRKMFRMQMAFDSFLDIIDDKVVVSDKQEREFVSDNLDEINKRVQEILNAREKDDEVIEVITTPKIEPVEEATNEEIIQEDVVEEAVTPEPEEEVITFADLTEEEKKNYFEDLINIVNTAVNDPDCTLEDLCELAAAIDQNAGAIGVYQDEEDTAQVEECFRILASKLSPEQVEEVDKIAESLE